MAKLPPQGQEGGYPCRVACLWCSPNPAFFTLDQLAEHYIRVHPISQMVLEPEQSPRVVER